MKFNEKKAAQAATLILRLSGGSMKYLKLIRIMYSADREALRRWGRPVSTDRYVAMESGPVLSRVFDLIRQTHSDSSSIWNQYVKTSKQFAVDVTSSSQLDELSEAEIAVLSEAITDVELVFSEWKKPESGAYTSIQFKDILIAVGKSESEATVIAEELDFLTFLDDLLPA